MILVDTSIWIDHLHEHDRGLAALLAADEVGCHRYVVEELGLGSLKQRDTVLQLLESLRQFPVVNHHEVMALINARSLWGRGLSAVDCHILGAVVLVGGAQLWTRDKRLIAACENLGVAYAEHP